MTWRKHETWSPDLRASVKVFGLILLVGQVVVNSLHLLLLAHLSTNAIVLGLLPMFLILAVKGPMYRSNHGRLKFDRDVQRLGV